MAEVEREGGYEERCDQQSRSLDTHPRSRHDIVADTKQG
jgi:hypothetical protein